MMLIGREVTAPLSFNFTAMEIKCHKMSSNYNSSYHKVLEYIIEDIEFVSEFKTDEANNTVSLVLIF